MMPHGAAQVIRAVVVALLSCLLLFRALVDSAVLVRRRRAGRPVRPRTAVRTLAQLLGALAFAAGWMVLWTTPDPPVAGALFLMAMACLGLDAFLGRNRRRGGGRRG